MKSIGITLTIFSSKLKSSLVNSLFKTRLLEKSYFELRK